MRVQFTPLSYLDIAEDGGGTMNANDGAPIAINIRPDRMKKLIKVAEEEMPILTLSERISYWRRHMSDHNCRKAEETVLKLAKCSPEEIATHMAAFDAEWEKVARC